MVKGRCIDVSPDGKLIAAGYKDGTVRVKYFLYPLYFFYFKY